MSIVNDEPKDTYNTLHIYSDCTLEDILDKAKKNWGDVDPALIKISALHFHSRCITHDQHCPEDWDDFVVIEYQGG